MLSVFFAAAVSVIPPQCLYANPPELDAKKIEAKILGVAKSLGDKSHAGELLYCEFHYPVGPDKMLVNYISNGQIIATKKLNFSASAIAPNVDQLDYRSGEQRSAVMTKDWQVDYVADRSAEPESKVLEAIEGTVVDAGFDNFVRAHWAQLQSDKKLSFPFLSIPHLRALMLRATKQSLSDCGANKTGYTCFKVGADSAILRLFVGDLTLLYDEQKRLLTFEGVVNIQDDKAESQAAKINYFYF